MTDDGDFRSTFSLNFKVRHIKELEKNAERLGINRNTLMYRLFLNYLKNISQMDKTISDKSKYPEI